VHVPAVNIVGDLDQGWDTVEKVLPKVYVAQCAEMLGGFEQALDLTVSYTKERVQWGYPLGAFQSIQHMCARMAVDLDISRFLTYEAAWKIDKGLPFTTEASMAKAWVSNAYWQATILGQQIHGGVGYVEDPDIALFTRKAKALEVTFGDSDFHREKVAQGLGL